MHPILKPIQILAVVTLFLTSGEYAQAQPEPPTELLSFQGVKIPNNWFVDSFSIKTWGVLPIAVCRIPPAWKITAGKDSDPEGVLSGTGDTFGSLLGQKQFELLLFLVKVDSYQAKREGNIPPTFSGTVSLNTYGNGKLRTIKLNSSNFIRHRADRCP